MVTIRLAGTADLPAARKVSSAAFAQNRSVYRPKPTARPILSAQATDVITLVAFDGDQVVGTGSFWIEGIECHLGTIAVDPSHRGRGIGRALVQEIDNLSRARGATVQVTKTIRQAGQVEFYERMGFTIVSEREPTWAEPVVPGQPISEVELRSSIVTRASRPCQVLSNDGMVGLLQS